MSKWKIYRTRFLVEARQLTETTVVRDHAGRFQTGQPGDYLVQGSDGTQRISPRHVFEDVYVEMSAAESPRRPARPLQVLVQPGNPSG
jgi:hypothetical protein